jgi:hypothetical protein
MVNDDGPDVADRGAGLARAKADDDGFDSFNGS